MHARRSADLGVRHHRHVLRVDVGEGRLGRHRPEVEGHGTREEASHGGKQVGERHRCPTFRLEDGGGSAASARWR
ncbi:hypothetical protein ACFPRL_34490 [Pseudoclavibacter helvolus]